MITGSHALLYSRDADADRAFLRDVLGLPHVDAGGGWLIFGLPAAELAVHPSEDSGHHEIYLTCGDVKALVRRLRARGVRCKAPSDMGWGIATQVTLPGGGRLGVYEPRHAQPSPAKRRPARSGTAKKRSAKRTAAARTATTRPATSRAAGRRTTTQRAGKRPTRPR